MLLRFVRDAMSETGKGEIKAKNRTRHDEGEEIAVVATTNTVVEPDTVMV